MISKTNTIKIVHENNIEYVTNIFDNHSILPGNHIRLETGTYIINTILYDFVEKIKVLNCSKIDVNPIQYINNDELELLVKSVYNNNGSIIQCMHAVKEKYNNISLKDVREICEKILAKNNI